MSITEAVFCVKNVCMEPYKRSVIAELSWILKLDGHKYVLVLKRINEYLNFV
jgi:hypothetical protein